jgi:hypothetical protein
MFKKIINSKSTLIVLIIFTFFTISLITFIPVSYAQTNGEPISFSSSIRFNEYAEVRGIKENISEVNIQLPEVNWTVTDLQINFSNISHGNEIITIEDTETTLDIVENKNSQFRTFALGTQLEILEVTELFGVYIKGQKTLQANETIKFQIQGFNENNHTPNNEILRSIDLNISTNYIWHYQDFSLDPITLQVGNYSLVMNGTSLPIDVEAKYYWALDDSDPQIKFLHTSSYLTSWSTGAVNSTFLYKLNQRIDEIFFPSDLNMSTRINGSYYEIINGLIFGSGSLEILDIDYFLEETNLNIPIITNVSYSLKFSYNYSITLSNMFITRNFVEIEESQNYWSMSPIMHRISQDYCTQFEIPKNWYNFTIYRRLETSWENVTSLVSIDLFNKSINIPNNTIEDGAEWKVEANSPNINFNLEMTNAEWMRGDELEFSVNAPLTQGNLTFIIIKPSGKAEFIEIKELVSGLIFFSFEIPSNWTEGSYIGKIYWNNETDVGVQSQAFQIIIPPVAPTPINIPILVVTISLIIIGITILSFGSFVTARNYRRKFLEKKQNIYAKCVDIMNLDYLMVTDKTSGLNVYTQNFSGKEIEAALISGFLQAIHSFGIEMMKVEDRSQTIKLEYQNFIVLMSEFVNFRLILLMKKSPSRNFLYSLEDLAYDVYKDYGDKIDSFNGDVNPFKGIKELLKVHLNIPFISPLKIAKIEKMEKVRINQAERVLINQAVKLLKTQNQDYFFMRDLLPGEECNPKDIEGVLNLMNKKIFYPL